MARQLRNPLRALAAARPTSGPLWRRLAPGRFSRERSGSRAAASRASGLPLRSDQASAATVDLEARRQRLASRVAELQWDLGGLAYEMAIRDHMRVEVLVARAAILQEADAELAEVERVMRMERGAAAGSCSLCGAMHSRGAAFCWGCGQALITHVTDTAAGRRTATE